jgi:hypothetical protein
MGGPPGWRLSMTFESAGGSYPFLPAQEEVIMNRIRRDAAQPAARPSRGPGHHASVMPSAAPARQNRPASTVMVSLLHKLIAPGLLPHTVQLCIHCQEDPAGFWVSRKNAKTVRRPWCLSCCDVLDRGRYDVVRFGS